jgi:hypothetical protein
MNNSLTTKNPKTENVMGSEGGSPAHFGVPPRCPFSALRSVRIAHFREDFPAAHALEHILQG